MKKINKNMAELLISVYEKQNEFIKQKVEEFSTKVFEYIKLVDDRIVIIDLHNEVEDGKLNYSWVFSRFGDLTGFEISCNEMRLTDYIDFKDISILMFTYCLLEELKRKLVDNFPKFHFTIIVSIDGTEDVVFRFHMIREYENEWLSENLDSYENAILVEII